MAIVNSTAPDRANRRAVSNSFGRNAVSQHPALPYLRNSEKGKIVTAQEAVMLIRDGDTVATGGYPTSRYFDLFLLIDNERQRVVEWAADGTARELQTA